MRLSTLLFRSLLNFSKFFDVFAPELKNGLINQDRIPVNSSESTKVVDPEVVLLGSKRKVCSPTKTGHRLPIQPKARSVFFCSRYSQNTWTYLCWYRRAKRTETVAVKPMPSSCILTLSPFSSTSFWARGSIDLMWPGFHSGYLAKSRNSPVRQRCSRLTAGSAQCLPLL